MILPLQKKTIFFQQSLVKYNHRRLYLFFLFITLINYKNTHKNNHKSKYAKKQIIICINNVYHENEKYETLRNFHDHFYERFCRK